LPLSAGETGVVVISDGNDVIQLINQLANSSERQLAIQLEALRISHRLFASNYTELIAFLDLIESEKVAIPLHDVKRRREFIQVLDEVTRLLHNFLASAKTLIDHTRSHIRRLYQAHPFSDEYNSKLKEQLASSPVRSFVQDLRNYTQHYTLPLAGSHTSWNRESGLTITYFVDAKELRKWDNWAYKSRQYLNTFDEIMPVRQIASDYFSLVNKFYEWLHSRQLEVNSEQLSRLREMEERLAKFQE
jgi:hypothetical protein